MNLQQNALDLSLFHFTEVTLDLYSLTVEIFMLAYVVIPCNPLFCKADSGSSSGSSGVDVAVAECE